MLGECGTNFLFNGGVFNNFLLLCSSVRPQICNYFAFAEVCTQNRKLRSVDVGVESNFGDVSWKIGCSKERKTTCRIIKSFQWSLLS